MIPKSRDVSVLRDAASVREHSVQRRSGRREPPWSVQKRECRHK